MPVCVFRVYLKVFMRTRGIYNADNCIDFPTTWVSYNLVYRITNSCPLFLYVPV